MKPEGGKIFGKERSIWKASNQGPKERGWMQQSKGRGSMPWRLSERLVGIRTCSQQSVRWIGRIRGSLSRL
jgi:hypothetical protein